MDLCFLKIKSGRSRVHARFQREWADSRFSHRISAVKDSVYPSGTLPHTAHIKIRALYIYKHVGREKLQEHAGGATREDNSPSKGS